MRSLEDALAQFAYHPATPNVSSTYAYLRNEVMGLATRTWDSIPDGPEKTIAMRGLQQFLMHANLAVALTTPADLNTAHVARVMPAPDEFDPTNLAPAWCACGQVRLPQGFVSTQHEGIVHGRKGCQV